MKSLKLAALGVAAFGAVASGAGAFATNTATGSNLGGSDDYTDHIVVNVAPACTFTRKATAHTNGANHSIGTEGATEVATGTWGTEDTADTLTGTLGSNDKAENFGSSHFNIICNNKLGWKVTADTKALQNAAEDTGATQEIAFLGYNKDAATTTSAQASNWALKVSALEDTFATKGTEGSAIILTNKDGVPTTDIDGTDFTIQYSVATRADLKSDTYEGDVTYTFAQLQGGRNVEMDTVLESRGCGGDVINGEGGTEKSEQQKEETPAEEVKEEEPAPAPAPARSYAPLMTTMQPTYTTVNNIYTTPEESNGNGGQTVVVRETQGGGNDSKSEEGKADALGVLSTTGDKNVKTLAKVSGEPEDDHSALIVAMCAAGVAATAAAGAYLYNKSKEVE